MKIKDINKIFIITLLDNKDRVKIAEIFKNEMLKYNENTELSYSVYYPQYFNKIQSNVNDIQKSWSFPSNVAIVREHYRLIKQSYLLGYEYIMICEDDISFNENCNLELIQKTLDNIPDDGDIIRFLFNDYNEKDINTFDTDDYYRLQTSPCWGAYCYILSRKAMKYYLDFYDNENNFDVADIIFCYHNRHNKNLKYYNCNKFIFKFSINQTYNTSKRYFN